MGHGGCRRARGPENECFFNIFYPVFDVSFWNVFLWLSVKIAIIMTMIAGRVGEKTQPITLILHPDIVDNILRLTFQCILMKKTDQWYTLNPHREGLTTTKWRKMLWNLIDKNILNRHTLYDLRGQTGFCSVIEIGWSDNIRLDVTAVPALQSHLLSTTFSPWKEMRV